MSIFSGKAPLDICPWPEGKRFAITFVDDTDYSTRANTEPVYNLLQELGILGTKTVWTSPQKRNSAFRRDLERPHDLTDFNGATLEDEDYREFIQTLAARGYEIALHNVAAGNSTRSEIIAGLERFRNLFGADPRMNIFHAQNIENIYAGQDKLDTFIFRVLERLKDRSDYQGHVQGSPYFWGDLAQERITYTRLPFHTIQQTNTLRWNPSMPFHDPRRPFINYWFASSDGSNCRRFLRLLAHERVDQLERERGACVVYTHFAAGFARLRDGSYRLDHRFETLAREIARRGSCWFPTASQLLDRLRGCRQIDMRQNDFTVELTNLGEPVPALALAATAGTVLTDENGTKFQADEHGLVSIGNLPARETRRFVSSRRAQFHRPAQPGLAIPRWERKRLELLNYLGLLRA
jgi:hypothetical protein